MRAEEASGFPSTVTETEPRPGTYPGRTHEIWTEAEAKRAPISGETVDISTEKARSPHTNPPPTAIRTIRTRIVHPHQWIRRSTLPTFAPIPWIDASRAEVDDTSAYVR